MADKIEEIPKLIKDASQRQYLPGDMLGRGGFASVWRAKMVDRRAEPEADECALKVVRKNIKSEQMRTRFKFELGIHNKLRHPNIVEFYRAFTHDDLTFVSLELCENGSLTDVVKRRKFLTMGEMRRWLIQLSGAVKYLHTRDVVHRDIKAGNIFLDKDMNAKLGDFGLASIMVPTKDLTSYTRRTTFCGTPNYLAPEVLSRGGHDKSVDIWAIGILAYYLAVGRAPFHSKSKDEIYERVRKADYNWPDLGPESNEIPEDLKSLVASLLVPETERPSPDEVVRHAFFSRGFVPERIDPLARTRRPRWARMPSQGAPESTAAYEQCCRESRVGIEAAAEGASAAAPAPTLKRKRKHRHDEELLLRTLEYEYSDGIRLEVPLPEGELYLSYFHGDRNAKKLASVASNIREEAEPRPERNVAITSEPATRKVIQPPQLPPLPAYPSLPSKPSASDDRIEQETKQPKHARASSKTESKTEPRVEPRRAESRAESRTGSRRMESRPTSRAESRADSKTAKELMPPPPPPASRPASAAATSRAGSARRALAETTGNRGSASRTVTISSSGTGKVARAVAAIGEATANASKFSMPTLGRAKRPRRAAACYD